jgi:uncharacterized protein (TIGR03663 family)
MAPTMAVPTRHSLLRSSRLPWLILGLALALRLVWLPLRPPHSDEGVNGWFAERVLAEGFYHYDPENYHGPLHYYLLALTRLLLGHNLWALRLPTVLFGVGAVGLALLLAGALGRRTAWTAALFLAVSPALVLYSRWAIHESEFLFFSLLAWHGGCRWRRRPSRAALWEVGVGLAGALATKEVWVVHAAALVGAWWVWRLTRRFVGEPLAPATRPPWRWVAPVAVVSLGALALLYSGFGRDPDGLARFFAPYAIWTTRAMQGAGHEKAWHYWLMLFARYEPAALAGLVAAPWAALVARAPIRPLALYGLAGFVAYSVIHYKTPWCVLELVWPFCFVAAWALSYLADRTRPWLASALAAGLAAASLVPCVRVNFLRFADNAEPYVYVQTVPEALEPVTLLERAAAADPTLRDETIHVVMKLSWPLPWLLADFHHVGHWGGDQLPPGDAVVIFVDDAHREPVEARLSRRYLVLPFKLSPAHAQAYAYFDAARFAGRLPAAARTFDPGTAASRPASPRPLSTTR